MVILKQFVERKFETKFKKQFSSSNTNDCGVLSNNVKHSMVLDQNDFESCQITFSSRYNTYVVISLFQYAGQQCLASLCLNTSDYKVAITRQNSLFQANSFAIKGNPHQGEDCKGFYSLLCDVVAIEYTKDEMVCNSSFKQELEAHNFNHWDDIEISDEVFPSIKYNGILPNVKNILREKHIGLALKMCQLSSIYFIGWTILFGIKSSIKTIPLITCIAFPGGIIKGAIDRDKKIKSFS